MNMRDISKKIGLIADEIFDVEMENFENKFYQDLNHKGLEGFDTVVEMKNIIACFIINCVIFGKQKNQLSKKIQV